MMNRRKKNYRKIYWIIGIAVWIGLALAGVEYKAETMGLELRSFVQTGKMIYLWFIMPFVVLFAMNFLIAAKRNYSSEENNSQKTARIIWSVVISMVILAAGGIRLFFADGNILEEYVMEDGYLYTSWSNMLGRGFYGYYEPVGVFFRRRFPGWSQDELVLKVQELYGEDAEYVEAQENNSYVFRIPDGLAEDEYIYFHVWNTYDTKNNGLFQILLSEACHFWRNRDRFVSLDEKGEASLESGRDMGEADWEEDGSLYVRCYDTEADITACAADLVDWLDFVESTGQFPFEDEKAYELMCSIYVGNIEHYCFLGRDLPSVLENTDSWDAHYLQLKENISEGFQAYQEWLEEKGETYQEQGTEETVSEEEYDQIYMENYDGSYEQECLVGDGTVRYRAVVLDAALGSRWYGILKSSDGGESWEVWSRDPFDSTGMGIELTFLSEDYGFAALMHNGGDSADLYVTEDGGKSYQAVAMQQYTVALDDGYTYAPYDYPQMPYEENGIIYVLCGQGADGDYDGGDAAGLALYQSTDGGHTFTFVKIQK